MAAFSAPRAGPISNNASPYVPYVIANYTFTNSPTAPLGDYTLSTADFIQLAGPAAEGIYAAVPYASTMQSPRNQAFVKKYLDGRNAVGQVLRFGTFRVPIVGVVGDVHQTTVDESPLPRVYASVFQIFRIRVNLVARTRDRCGSRHHGAGLQLSDQRDDHGEGRRP